jgi:hypothetical protein
MAIPLSQSAFVSSRTVATTTSACASLPYEHQPRDVPPDACYLLSIS